MTKKIVKFKNRTKNVSSEVSLKVRRMNRIRYVLLKRRGRYDRDDCARPMMARYYLYKIVRRSSSAAAAMEESRERKRNHSTVAENQSSGGIPISRQKRNKTRRQCGIGICHMRHTQTVIYFSFLFYIIIDYFLS